MAKQEQVEMFDTVIALQSDLSKAKVVCDLMDANAVELGTVCNDVRVAVIMTLSELLGGVIEKLQERAEQLELAV